MITEYTQRTLKNLWTVWCWIESFGGTLNDRLITLNDPINPHKTHPFRGKDYLQEAAEWVESYRKVVKGGA